MLWGRLRAAISRPEPNQQRAPRSRLRYRCSSFISVRAVGLAEGVPLFEAKHWVIRQISRHNVRRTPRESTYRCGYIFMRVAIRDFSVKLT